MSRAVPKTFHIVRHVNLDDDTLKKVAEALGIPAHEHDRIVSISGEIHIAPPSTPGGGASSTSAGGNPPASGTSGGGRRSG
jgi:hypothetical protein